MNIIVLCFFIYSILGWICEVFYTKFQDKAWINRGFLIGPYCPIYGIACLIMIIFFNKHEDIISIFLKIILICGILEYFTSYIFEKIFNARWWDYSEKKFNINGRICLETLLLFGIAGVIFVYFINPFTIKILKMIPNFLISIIDIILIIIFVLDIIISSKIILKFRKFTKKNIKLDRTVEISKLVRKKLIENSKKLKRLIKAFPHLKAKIKYFSKNK